MLAVLFLCGLASLPVASPCCYPAGPSTYHLTMNIGYVPGGSKVGGDVEAFGRRYADPERQLESYWWSFNVTQFYDFYYHVRYTYNQTDGTCVSVKFPEELQVNCIPVGAKLVGQGQLGLSPDSLQTRTYKYAFNLGGTEGETFFTVTAQQCMPVGGVFMGHDSTSGLSLLEGYKFYDYVAAVDPDALNIPRACVNLSR